MISAIAFRGVAASVLLAAAIGPASAATLSDDFESPAYTVGPIGGNPPYTQGQGGWGGFGTYTITTAFAHGGTQSLLTSGTGSLYKALDSGNPFDITYGNDWWVQGWVRVTSGGSGATLAVANGLGGCPLIALSGNATPYFNSCLGQDTGQPNPGANALDQWLLLRIVHTVSMGQGVDLTIAGTGVNVHSYLGQYSGPGSGNPVVMVLSGDAYWDDISAGYGAVPASVPVPAAGLLLASGIAPLFRLRRRSPKSPS
jgi:hypothetical protein